MRSHGRRAWRAGSAFTFHEIKRRSRRATDRCLFISASHAAVGLAKNCPPEDRGFRVATRTM